MAIEYQKKAAVFIDTVSVEEAEGLLGWLLKHPHGRVDLSLCKHLHAANLQVLMAASPSVIGWPQDANLSAWLKSSLKSN